MASRPIHKQSGAKRSFDCLKRALDSVAQGRKAQCNRVLYGWSSTRSVYRITLVGDSTTD